MKIINLSISKKNKLTNYFALFLITTILSYFLIFSNTNYKIMIDIIDIFMKNVLPALFPFILFSNILIYSNYFSLLSHGKLSKIFCRFFGFSNLYMGSAIIFGFLFGYPNGARYVNDLYEKKKISFKEATCLLQFTNNSSPTYVLSAVGVSMLDNIKIGVFLYIVHVLASIILGKICSFKITSNKDSDNKIDNINPKLSFEVITKSIIKSVYTMCIIFGFMLVFIIANNFIKITISLICKRISRILQFTLPLMEITSGLNFLVKLDIPLKLLIVAVSFFLGFSSLSICFQIYSCVYANKFKFMNILKAKFWHGILSSLIAYVLLSIPHIYEQINIGSEVFSNAFTTKYPAISALRYIIYLMYISSILIYFIILKKKRSNNRLFKGG